MVRQGDFSGVRPACTFGNRFGRLGSNALVPLCSLLTFLGEGVDCCMFHHVPCRYRAAILSFFSFSPMMTLLRMKNRRYCHQRIRDDGAVTVAQENGDKQEDVS